MTTPNYTYHVIFKSDSHLRWVTEKGGVPTEYDDEPETGCWRRFNSALLGRLAPEKWL